MTKQRLAELKQILEKGIENPEKPPAGITLGMRCGKYHAGLGKIRIDMCKAEDLIRHNADIVGKGMEVSINYDAEETKRTGKQTPFSISVFKKEDVLSDYTQIQKDGVNITLGEVAGPVLELLEKCLVEDKIDAVVAPSAGVQAQKRILVVDDEESIASLAGRFLVREGYSAKVFNNSADALKELVAGDYDLLMTDHKMPGMDGDELIRKIKEIKPGMRAIIMSGGTFTQEDMKKEENKHIDAFIRKPFELDELKALIERIVAADPR